jgi:hypothetical protein
MSPAHLTEEPEKILRRLPRNFVGGCVARTLSVNGDRLARDQASHTTSCPH